MQSQPCPQPSPESDQSPYSFNPQPMVQISLKTQIPLIDNPNPQTNLQEQLLNDSLKRLYCQPCYKRGLMNEPIYLNLNEFESNRYICEGCSFGQSYIIQLEKDFKRDIVKDAKNQKKFEAIGNISNAKNREIDKKANKTYIQNQGKNQKNPKKSYDTCLQSTTQHPTSQTSSSSSQPFTPQFAHNISINHNDFSKYSPEDITQYTQNIIKEYNETVKAIEKYEEMVVEHIKKWKKEIKVQFEGVIGTFGDKMMGKFFEELKKLEMLENRVKGYEENLKLQGVLKGLYENQYGKEKIIITTIQTQQQIKHKSINPLQLTLQKHKTTSLNSLYTKTKQNYQLQKQIVQTFVQILKMSGSRNLSNLAFLYRSCKGFSDAVQILVNLQQQQTRRRFQFISRKVKVCSIQATYDADMINNGLLDNRIERPPVFDQVLVGNVAENRVNSEKNSHKSRRNTRKNNQNREETMMQIQQQNLIKTSKQLPQQAPIPIKTAHSQTLLLTAKQQQKNPQQNITSQHVSNQQPQLIKQSSQHMKNQINSQYKQEITNAVLAEQAQAFEKVRLAKINQQKPFSSGILNANKMARDEAVKKERDRRRQKEKVDGVEIDLQQQAQHYEGNNKVDLSAPHTPYLSMRQFYTYQKHRNLHQSKLQLTSLNFERFPPPEVYLPSVQSLTLKYAPDHIEPQKFLTQVSASFRKLIQLIIDDPKFATKNAIIMIAELFPKLKSLVIRCENQFDWELGKYFEKEKKMRNLVRFEVNPEKKGE